MNSKEFNSLVREMCAEGVWPETARDLAKRIYELALKESEKALNSELNFPRSKDNF